MSNKCDLTSTRALYGNNVSHSMRKTRKKFNPNIHSMKLMSDVLQQKIRVKITASTLRSIEKAGGLDAFIANAPSEYMIPRIKKIKKLILMKTSSTIEKAS